MDRTRLEEEKLRVQAKEKKDQSNSRLLSCFLSSSNVLFILGANASPEVKTHLKSFLCRKLQKEGKLG